MPSAARRAFPLLSCVRTHCCTLSGIQTQRGCLSSVLTPSFVSHHQCAGTCLYYYTSMLTPTITSGTPPNGSASLAAISTTGSLTLNGTRLLSANATDYSINVDGTPCPVVSLAVDSNGRGSIVCQMPILPAGLKVLRVRLAGRGDAVLPASMPELVLKAPVAPTPSELPLAYAVKLTSATPARGSFWGGATLNISGFGLASTNASGLPASPGSPLMTVASVYGATPAGAAISANLLSADAAAGWAVVALGRMTAAAATPSTFQLSVQLSVVNASTGASLAAGIIAYTLDKSYTPVVSAVNISSPAAADGTRLVTLAWSVALGGFNPANGSAPWAAPGGLGGPSAASVTIQSRAIDASFVAGPLLSCNSTAVLASVSNTSAYTETLQCQLPGALPAANYTVWGELWHFPALEIAADGACMCMWWL